MVSISTPRSREAARASAAYQLAITQVGAESLTDLLALWEKVPEAGKQAQINAWLDDAVALILGRHGLSSQIALAYYRLARALATGSTIADPDTPEPRTVSLQKLRSAFASLVDPRLNAAGRAYVEAAGSDSGPPAASRGAATPSSTEPDGGKLRVETEGGDEKISVELLDLFAARRKQARTAAEQEARTVVEQLGPVNRDRKVDEATKKHNQAIIKAVRGLRQPPSADDLDFERVEAQAQAGYRMAAAGERIAQNGARSTTWAAGDSDKRAIGWIRLSRTGTPCGWCAMLISRGPVYKSESVATYSEGDLYHDNCHCYSMPVWSKDDYKNNPLYALNREYRALWDDVVKNGDPLHPTDAQMTIFRRYFRTKPRAQAA